MIMLQQFRLCIRICISACGLAGRNLYTSHIGLFLYSFWHCSQPINGFFVSLYSMKFKLISNPISKCEVGLLLELKLRIAEEIPWIIGSRIWKIMLQWSRLCIRINFFAFPFSQTRFPDLPHRQYSTWIFEVLLNPSGDVFVPYIQRNSNWIHMWKCGGLVNKTNPKIPEVSLKTLLSVLVFCFSKSDSHSHSVPGLFFSNTIFQSPTSIQSQYYFEVFLSP